MPVVSGTRLRPYKVVELLGHGGMGEVWRARDSHLGREVSVKVLHDHALQDADARQRFRNEGVALCRLSHPNVAALFDVGAEGDVDFLVMEVIPGESLADLLRQGPVRDLLPLALQLAEGMTAAHPAGIVPRDLKPARA